jgi:alpha-L-rhamnosidase
LSEVVKAAARLPEGAGSGRLSDLDGCDWIASEKWLTAPDDSLPRFATEFWADASSAVRLTLAVAGVVRIWVNGAHLGPYVLEPGYVDYTQVCEVSHYDLTALSSEGFNTLAIDVGPGMYRSRAVGGRWSKLSTDFGDLAIRGLLEVSFGEATVHHRTGSSWRVGLSGTVRSNWTGGEDYDANVAGEWAVETHKQWPAAVICSNPPRGALVARASTPVRIAETFDAISVRAITNDTQIIDFGTNIAGWPEVTLPPMSSVRLRPAELLESGGGIDASTQGWGPVYHRVSSAQGELTWHPSFMYNGFRYLEVQGIDSAIDVRARAHVIAADVERGGGFACSDATLNRLQALIDRSVKSNMFSLFTDCPQREKLGYLEQLHLDFDAISRNYAAQSILDHTLNLTVQAQRDDGSVPLYVPNWEEFPEPWTGDVNWGGVLGFLPLLIYRESGDLGPARRSIAALERYLDYLESSLTDHVLATGLGDWDGRDFRYVPVVGSATYYRLLGAGIRLKELLGDSVRISRWRELADRVRDAVQSRLYSESLGFGTGTIAENAVGLDAGLAPSGHDAHIVNLLVEELRRSNHSPDVGEVGMRALVNVLSRHGLHQDLYALTQQTELPGYGYMLAHGATSLTETWDGPTFGFSQNHFMNAPIASWLYRWIGGIDQEIGSTAYESAVLRAGCLDLAFASCWVQTPRGRLDFSWERGSDQIRARGTVPPWSRAKVVFPNSTYALVGPGSFDITHAL